MAEVAHVGEEHCNTVLVGGGNHFVITDRTARLDYAGHARSGGGINTVAEREERVRSPIIRANLLSVPENKA